MNEPSNVVSKLCSDGSVCPVERPTTLGELVNLVNYKIRTEGEMANKHKTQTTAVTTGVIDLGKQLLLYAKDSDLKGVQTMLTRGAPFTSDWLGMSALHFAAMNNQYEICDVLIKGGMNKDIKTKVDRTPLHFAAYYGHERIVEMLLSCECAVNPKDMLLMTPLHWAVERRQKNIVRLLLKYNADVNVVTKFNKTPIGIAVYTEQADILAELQTAKAEQAKRKFNKEQEKEISSAVGTILIESSNITRMPNSNDLLKEEVVHESSSSVAKMGPQMQHTQNAAVETTALDRSAINLLKSHGIAMMPDEDEDASKELLSTALQNGRQLVLSEGGKLLLNETRQHHSSIKSTPIDIENQITNDKKIGGFSVAENSKSQKQVNTDHQTNSVQIVSYKEFQHMFYNNPDGRPVEKSKVPTMSNFRIIQQQRDSAAVNLSSASSTGRSSQQALNQQQQHRQLKITPMKQVMSTATVNAGKTMSSRLLSQDAKDLSDLIEILPDRNDDEDDVGAFEEQSTGNYLKNGICGTSPTVRFISAGITSHTTPATSAISATNTTTSPSTPASARQSHAIKRPHSQQTTSHNHQQTHPLKMPAINVIKQSPNVMPLLSTPDICRELYEMRKLNEELLRRVDALEKEKEDRRQRLDRLEELLLVESVNENYEDNPPFLAGLTN